MIDALESATWQMRDGTCIEVRSMTTSHIENCIAMLERNMGSMPYPMFQGEMAQMYAEHEYDSFMDSSQQWIEIFNQELRRREFKRDLSSINFQ